MLLVYDDLSVIEVTHLVMSGICSYNFRQHVASDIGNHGQYLPISNIQSEKHLDEINNWTHDNQMALNRNKTKYMVVNFTKKFQFNTRISLEDTLLQEVSTCKLLGVHSTMSYLGMIKPNPSSRKQTKNDYSPQTF